MKVLSLTRDVFKSENGSDIIVSIRIDNANNLFHIMDLDDTDCTLEEVLSEGFLKSIIDTYQTTLGHKYKIKEYEEYIFLLYLINGNTCVWSNDSIKPFCDNESMYEGFRIISQDRRRTN